MGQIVDNCCPSGSSLQSTHGTIKFGTKLSQEEEDSCNDPQTLKSPDFQGSVLFPCRNPHPTMRHISEHLSFLTRRENRSHE